jgi:hypothetical protein
VQIPFFCDLFACILFGLFCFSTLSLFCFVVDVSPDVRTGTWLFRLMVTLFNRCLNIVNLKPNGRIADAKFLVRTRRRVAWQHFLPEFASMRIMDSGGLLKPSEHMAVITWFFTLNRFHLLLR